MFTVRTFTDDQITEARNRYDAGEPLATIAAQLGVSLSGLRACRRRWGWPERSRRGVPAPAPAKADTVSRAHGKPSRRPPNLGTLTRRIDAAVRRELTGLEKRLGACADPAEAERSARVLASLVKSLVELGRLEAARLQTGAAGKESGDAQPDDSRPPRDLAALRDALAARLERLRAERDAE